MPVTRGYMRAQYPLPHGPRPALDPTPPSPAHYPCLPPLKHMSVQVGLGLKCFLVFSVDPASGLTVAPATSRAIQAMPCDSTSFYVKGNASCQPCHTVPGAKCNGSDVLLTQPNHWRLKGSLRFFECRAVVGSSGQPRCIGGVATGTCSEGFTGPLCALCETWRTGDACRQCPTDMESGLLVLAILVAYSMGVAFVSHRAFRADPSAKRQSFLNIVKIAVAYFQILYILSDLLPSNVKQLSFAGEGVTPKMPNFAIRCLAPSLGTTELFYLNMAFPIMSLLVCLIVKWYDSAVGFKDWRQVAQMHPSQLQKIRERSFVRGRNFAQILLTSFSVVLYFLYPTLMQQNARLHTCDTYDFGPPPALSQAGTPADRGAYGVHSYLAVDYAIDCSSQSYLRTRFASYIFTAVYGVGIPILLNVLGRFMNRCSPDLELRTFAFLMGGFRRRFRYWETLGMLRKGLLVAVVAFVHDDRIRLYLATWTLMVFVVLQYACRPFDTEVANALEAVSLVVLTVTLNLMLLWFTPWFMDGGSRYLKALELGVLGLILAAHGGLLLSFLCAAVRSLREVALAKWGTRDYELTSAGPRVQEVRSLRMAALAKFGARRRPHPHKGPVAPAAHDDNSDDPELDALNMIVHGRTFMTRARRPSTPRLPSPPRLSLSTDCGGAKPRLSLSNDCGGAKPRLSPCSRRGARPEPLCAEALEPREAVDEAPAPTLSPEDLSLALGAHVPVETVFTPRRGTCLTCGAHCPGRVRRFTDTATTDSSGLYTLPSPAPAAVAHHAARVLSPASSPSAAVAPPGAGVGLPVSQRSLARVSHRIANVPARVERHTGADEGARPLFQALALYHILSGGGGGPPDRA